MSLSQFELVCKMAESNMAEFKMAEFKMVAIIKLIRLNEFGSKSDREECSLSQVFVRDGSVWIQDGRIQDGCHH